LSNQQKKDGEIPKHVAFIMDGNRRWAKNHKKSIPAGHKQGLEVLENIIEPCSRAGIKFITFYSFSSENWERKKTEVQALMKLMITALAEKSKKIAQKGAKVRVIGRTQELPVEIQNGLRKLEDMTQNNKTINVAFALSYGGRQEIVDAVNKIDKTKISEANISDNLYAPEYPDPDLIIRTGGMHRLSGFLLWQSAYSELYFTNTLWPDFNGVELVKALNYYANIKRNFGK